MIDAISSALAGLQRAREQFADSAERVARGDIDPGTLVDSKINAMDVTLQNKNLKLMIDQEKETLDLLA